jgi:ABC-type uncharacterized transport system involved in gliding motility auxiliary subunit
VADGRFSSLYEGKPLPVDTAIGASPPPTSPLTRSGETRVVLVGDGDFARDQFHGGNRDNVAFFANLVDYLVDDAGLITIRSKNAGMPPLDQVSDGMKRALKYSALGLPPLLILLYGGWRWRMRRMRKKALEVSA